MKTRKIPMRTCAVTREKLPKQELLRIVRTPENNLVVDETGKVNGHGIYIKKDLSIMDHLINSKCIERTLEVEVPASFYEEIREVLSK